MSDIPGEIVAEFLSRVPARSLLRCRSVSKAWRSIIDSSSFIKLHLDRTLQTESDRKIVLQGNDLFWEADLDMVEKTNKVHYTKLDCPFKSQEGRVTNVIGSCHGILCLGGNYYDKTIALWNPTTREIFHIPSSSKLPCSFVRLGLGFGYDQKSDDYKVLTIIERVHGEAEARVYSVKLKSWRRIDSFPFRLEQFNGVLASGSLHFKCSINNREDANDDAIAAFDLETEAYRLVPQPEEFHSENRHYDMTVEALGGSLCMVCYYSESQSLDVWVMKESWRKVLTMREWNNLVWGSFLKVSNVRPVAYSRSGKEVFMVHGDILPLWYDLDKRTMRYVDFTIRHTMHLMKHHLYCGSLVKLSC